jgi:BNR repeat protein
MKLRSGASFWFLFPSIIILTMFSSIAAAQSTTTSWPSVESQLAIDQVIKGSALEQLIQANQDFNLLDPSEANDKIGIPPWLRVMWRKAHPMAVHPPGDPTGGYPRALKNVHQWMVTHQDLIPSKPETSAGPSLDNIVPGLEQRISGAQTTPRSESDIRLNYWDPSKIIAASNNGAGGGQAQFYSHDEGSTWGQAYLPLTGGDLFDSDPAVDWTSEGSAWSTTVGILSDFVTWHGRSYKSVDAGATWTFDATFSGSQTDFDKEMMWVDHSGTSSFKDNIYVIWHHGAPAYVNRRTGPGGSWQTPMKVSGLETTGTAIGGDVKSNSFGDVFGFWPDTATMGAGKIFMVKSTTGGVSYGAPVQITTTYDSYDIGIPSFNLRRALIYVSAGAYRTLTKDLAYTTWTDLSGETGCTSPSNEPGSNVLSNCKTRIWFSRSADGGTTWTTPVMVNNQSGHNDQFNQRLAVDETTGTLLLIYYDTVRDLNRLKTDLWYQTSTDDGVMWSAPVRLTTSQTDETTGGANLGNQYGDYNGLSGYGGTFFPSWTDRRNNGREEIWSRALPDCTSAPNTCNSVTVQVVLPPDNNSTDTITLTTSCGGATLQSCTVTLNATSGMTEKQKCQAMANAISSSTACAAAGYSIAPNPCPEEFPPISFSVTDSTNTTGTLEFSVTNVQGPNFSSGNVIQPDYEMDTITPLCLSNMMNQVTLIGRAKGLPIAPGEPSHVEMMVDQSPNGGPVVTAELNTFGGMTVGEIATALVTQLGNQGVTATLVGGRSIRVAQPISGNPIRVGGATSDLGIGIDSRVAPSGRLPTPVPIPPSVPTLSQSGVVVMLLLLTGIGFWLIRRQMKRASLLS